MTPPAVPAPGGACGGDGAGPPRPLAPAAGVDLRTVFTDHVRDHALRRLDEAEARRRAAFAAGDWEGHRQRVRAHVSAAYGDMPFGARGGPLRLRQVSHFELPGLQGVDRGRVENVLFDSFPGWQVNASVFVPAGEGPFPAVVIPVGHSGKQFDNYQIPAQALAALGFVAVLFDPPGQASEKQPGNDHFRDGVRTFLTGHAANRYFVLDALRCIDYLETRADVDLSRGVGMTGVSGGGVTTLFATLYDERIACQGPSCCVNRMADHPVGDLYAPCPETLWPGRLAAGVDALDVLLAAMPTPTLFMAGRHDEVFHVEWSRALAQEAAAGFAAAQAGARFDFFEDDAGHAYTLAQVARFAAWMHRWMLDDPAWQPPALAADAFPLLPYEQLRCRPAPEENMYTLNRAIARRQATTRAALGSPARAQAAVSAVVGAAPIPSSWEEGEAFQVWSQTSRQVLAVAAGLPLPATLLSPVPEVAGDAPWLVVFDEAGRRAALESSGPATRLSRMLQRDADLVYPHVLAVDLPGWGDTQPALVPYAMAGWGSMDRLTAYLSCAAGDGVLALRTRCAAALLRHLVEARGVDPGRIVVAGRGLGGAVALMAAALMAAVPVDGGVTLGGVVSWSGPASFQQLAEAPSYTWPAAAFLPDVLSRFDLPELAGALTCPVAILDPRDAERAPLDAATAGALYGELPPTVGMRAPCDDDAAVRQIEILLADAASGRDVAARRGSAPGAAR